MISIATISEIISINQTTTTSTAGTVRESVLDSKQPLFTFANGTGSGQSDLMWSTKTTLAASPALYDLTALVGATGTISMARVKMVYIENQSTTDGQVITVGGASTNPWTGYMSGTETVGAGGNVLRVSPLATGFLVSGTSKVLKVDPGANTITVRVVILGCSA